MNDLMISDLEALQSVSGTSGEKPSDASAIQSPSKELTSDLRDLISFEETVAEDKEGTGEIGKKRRRGRPRKGENGKEETGMKNLENYWKGFSSTKAGGDNEIEEGKDKQVNENEKQKGEDNPKVVTGNGLQTEDVNSNQRQETFSEKADNVFVTTKQLIRTPQKNNIHNKTTQTDTKYKANEEGKKDCPEEDRRDWESKIEEKWESRLAQLESLMRTEFETIRKDLKERKEEEIKKQNFHEELKRENTKYREEIKRLYKLIEDQNEELTCVKEIMRKEREYKNINNRQTLQKDNFLEHDRSNMSNTTGQQRSQTRHEETGRENDLSNQWAEFESANPTPTNNNQPIQLGEENWEVEKKERWARKKNIIVIGLTLTTRERKEEFERWILNVLKIEVRVNAMERIKNGWRITLEEWTKKREIMREKRKLNRLGWGVWIMDDLTDRQKDIQDFLEEEADRWRQRGKESKVVYQMIQIEGTWLKWDELEGELRLCQEKDDRRNMRRFRD
ncbi:trichohyalin-like [Leptopilina heterotoma]|uniref:trichohyalin-like n=1 Tax=Leptopilina heterotoma TaxID=63436 RepID=UPI001CA9FC4F|nr:trichohyalin-like [Leptopilina heterotoma]